MFRLPHWSSLAAIGIAVSGITLTLALEAFRGGEPLDEFGRVPAFALVEPSGKTVTLEDLSGRVWVADFIFTHCAGTCPMMSYQMQSLQDRLPESVRLVSITVDPARDTPEVLATYAARHEADPDRWLFLTGKRDQIYRLAKEGFHLAVDDTMGTEIEPITHSSRFALIDGEGRIRGYYDGTATDSLDRIVQDVQNLLAEGN